MNLTWPLYIVRLTPFASSSSTCKKMRTRYGIMTLNFLIICGNFKDLACNYLQKGKRSYLLDPGSHEICLQGIENKIWLPSPPTKTTSIFKSSFLYEIERISEKKTHWTLLGIILSFFLISPFIRESRSPSPPGVDLKEFKYLE